MSTCCARQVGRDKAAPTTAHRLAQASAAAFPGPLLGEGQEEARPLGLLRVDMPPLGQPGPPGLTRELLPGPGRPGESGAGRALQAHPRPRAAGPQPLRSRPPREGALGRSQAAGCGYGSRLPSRARPSPPRGFLPSAATQRPAYRPRSAPAAVPARRPPPLAVPAPRRAAPPPARAQGTRRRWGAGGGAGPRGAGGAARPWGPLRGGGRPGCGRPAHARAPSHTGYAHTRVLSAHAPARSHPYSPEDRLLPGAGGPGHTDLPRGAPSPLRLPRAQGGSAGVPVPTQGTPGVVRAAALSVGPPSFRASLAAAGLGLSAPDPGLPRGAVSPPPRGASGARGLGGAAHGFR